MSLHQLENLLPNRLGKGANVYLASAELAAVCAMTGRIPTPSEYLKYTKMLDTVADETYKYLNFNELERYVHRRQVKLSKYQKDINSIFLKMHTYA